MSEDLLVIPQEQFLRASTDKLELRGARSERAGYERNGRNNRGGGVEGECWGWNSWGPPHRDLIYLTTGFRVPRGMQNNGDSRLLQQFFIRKIISVKVGSPRDIEIVQISGKITPVGFNLS